jgi:hypothetical protein
LNYRPTFEPAINRHIRRMADAERREGKQYQDSGAQHFR